MNSAELNKVLGVCLAFIAKELQKNSSLIEQRLDSLVTPEILVEARQEILAEATAAVPLKELPDGLIFESHLDEAVSCLKLAVDKQIESVHTSLAENTAEQSELLERSKLALTESIDELRSIASDTQTHLDESVQKINIDIQASNSNLAESIQNSTAQLKEAIESVDTELKANLVNAITEQTQSISALQTSLFGDLARLSLEYDQKVRSLRSDTENLVLDSETRIVQALAYDKKQTLDKIDAINTSTTHKLVDLDKAKAEKNHTHNYAEVHHEHGQYATTESIGKLDKALTDSEKRISSTLDSLQTELAKKLDKTQGLTQAVKSELIVEIADLVKRSIRIPKDGDNGKDAHEWEFKWHPHSRGILMFKRSDQSEWIQRDLMPKVQPQSFGSGGFTGGGGGDGSKLTVLKTGALIEGNVSEIDFRGAVAVTKTGNGIVRVTVEGGAGGSAPNTGWAQYRDTEYTAISPFSINDGDFVTLQNNAGSKIETYLPVDSTAFYNATTQKITPTQIGNYDTITIRFCAIASTSTAYLDFGIDIGGDSGVIFRDIKVFPKGAGAEHAFSFVCPGFTLDTFVANGGIVKLGPVGGDIEVYGIEYQIARVHSA